MPGRIIIIGLLLLLTIKGSAQKNNTLFLMDKVPQSNLLNPAIPLSCKWYLGLPLLSSMHANYANSTFSYNQLFTPTSNNSFQPNLIGIIDRLHNKNSISTQLHLQWLAIGYKRRTTSYYFTITEKNNFLFTYPENALILMLKGNSQFIGEKVGFAGTGVTFNHYREYALGLSAKMNKYTRIGLRAKLLFGKFNISTKSLNLEIDSDPTTYYLDFSGLINLRTSLPLTISDEGAISERFSYNTNTSAQSLLLNRKNPGFALDAGIIYDLNKDWKFSASIIDFGFIRWRSHVNNVEGRGEFEFQGVYNSENGSSYFQGLSNTLIDSLELQLNTKNYTTMLPIKLMSGVNYHINDHIRAGAVGNYVQYRMKANASLTILGQYNPKPWLGFTGSYSIQNYALNNVGFGVFIGNRDIQFYAVSDNLLFIPKPLDVRNVNARLGLNILLGCEQKTKAKTPRRKNDFKCFGMENPDLKKYREDFIPWEKRKKRKRFKLLQKL